MGSVPIPFNKASGMNLASSTTPSQRGSFQRVPFDAFLSSSVRNIVRRNTYDINFSSNNAETNFWRVLAVLLIHFFFFFFFLFFKFINILLKMSRNYCHAFLSLIKSNSTRNFDLEYRVNSLFLGTQAYLFQFLLTNGQLPKGLLVQIRETTRLTAFPIGITSYALPTDDNSWDFSTPLDDIRDFEVKENWWRAGRVEYSVKGSTGRGIGLKWCKDNIARDYRSKRPSARAYNSELAVWRVTCKM